MITALIVATMICQAPQPDPKARGDGKPAVAEGRSKKSTGRNVGMSPEPNWEPAPGDRAEVVFDGAPACIEPNAVDEAFNAIRAGDREGIGQLFRSKRADRLPRGVKVLVLSSFRPEKIPQAPQVMSTREFSRQLMTAAPPPDFSRVPVEVRIIDGDLTGQKRYISEAFLAKPIPDVGIPQRRPKPRLVQPAAKPEVSKAQKATVLLQSARNLEKSGKLDGAAKFYREVIKDFADSPEAKIAAERLRSLEKR